MDLTYAAAIPQQEFVERRAKLATQMHWFCSPQRKKSVTTIVATLFGKTAIFGI